MKFSIPTFIFLAGILFFLSDCQKNPYEQSEGLYHYFCANCHMDDGTGLPGIIPPLKGSDFVKADPLQIACIVRHGLEGNVTVNDTTYNQPMPALKEHEITDFEITNIINYINQAWGNDYGYVGYLEVKARLEKCKK